VAVEERAKMNPEPLLGANDPAVFRLVRPAGESAFFLLPTMPAAPFPAA